MHAGRRAETRHGALPERPPHRRAINALTQRYHPYRLAIPRSIACIGRRIARWCNVPAANEWVHREQRSIIGQYLFIWNGTSERYRGRGDRRSAGGGGPERSVDCTRGGREWIALDGSSAGWPDSPLHYFLDYPVQSTVSKVDCTPAT